MLINQLFEEENSSNTMTLWHGGNNLEYSYHEMRPHTKGNWDHGPGLYLTTNFHTAVKYAKGGKKIYEVTIDKGTDIQNVTIPLEDGVNFVKKYCIGKYKKQIIDDLKDNMNRRGHLFLNAVVNLCFNYQALSTANTVALRRFVVDHGADYEIVRNYGGRSDDTVVVVYNPKIIRKVKAVKTSDVKTSDFVKPIMESIDQEYYMEEGCGIFAIALSKVMPGGKIGVISAINGERWSKNIHEFTHVFYHLNGENYDCKGKRSIEDMAKDFHLEKRQYTILGPFDPSIFYKKYMGNSDRKPLYGTISDINKAIEQIRSSDMKSLVH